jgi:hypothetical protein
LNSGVLDRGAKENRREFASYSRSPNRMGYVLVRGGFLVDNYITHLIVDFCELLDEFRSFFFGELQYRSRYLIGLDDLDSINIMVNRSLAEDDQNTHPFSP